MEKNEGPIRPNWAINEYYRRFKRLFQQRFDSRRLSATSLVDFFSQILSTTLTAVSVLIHLIRSKCVLKVFQIV